MTTIAVVIPSLGRPTLEAACASVRSQLAPGDALVVVGDGPEAISLDRSLELGCTHFTYTPFPTHDLGCSQRDLALSMLADLPDPPERVWFMGDDDALEPDALTLVRASCVPGYLVLTSLYHPAGRAYWWSFGETYCDAMALLELDGPRGEWWDRHGGDHKFVADTVAAYGSRVLHLPIVTYLIRPHLRQCPRYEYRPSA